MALSLVEMRSQEAASPTLPARQNFKLFALPEIEVSRYIWPRLNLPGVQFATLNAEQKELKTTEDYWFFRFRFRDQTNITDRVRGFRASDHPWNSEVF
jgi:hypothetical protein